MDNELIQFDKIKKIPMAPLKRNILPLMMLLSCYNEALMRIRWICFGIVAIKSQMEILTDWIDAETMTTFHHCGLPQRTEPSCAVTDLECSDRRC